MFPCQARGWRLAPEGASEWPVPAGIPPSTRQLGVSESSDLRPEKGDALELARKEKCPDSQGWWEEAHDSREKQHERPDFPETCIVKRGRVTRGRAGHGNNYLEFAFGELCFQKAFNILGGKKKKGSLLNSQLDKIANNQCQPKKPKPGHKKANADRPSCPGDDFLSDAV